MFSRISNEAVVVPMVRHRHVVSACVDSVDVLQCVSRALEDASGPERTGDRCDSLKLVSKAHSPWGFPVFMFP